MNAGFASVAMANPTNPAEYAKRGLKQAQTSGTEKAWVGEWMGDDTVVVDPNGNESTVGELRKATNFATTLNSNLIQEKLLAPEQVIPKFEVNAASLAYGHAWPYYAINSSYVNCYAYAVSFPYAINPGFGDGVENYTDSGYFTDVFYTASLTIQDANYSPVYFKPSWRLLSGRTSSVTESEHRIALRVGWIDANGNGKVDLNSDVVDYHYMLQNSTGLWSEKHGQQPSQNTAISDPSTFTWSLGNYTGFYNSLTAYIAAKVY